MALTLSNSAAVKAVGDYMREGTAYERPLDAGVIERLIYAGVLLGPGIPGGDNTNPANATKGETKAVLGNAPLTGLLKLIVEYSGGTTASIAPLQSAINLLVQGTAYQTPLDETIAKLIARFAASASFPAQSKGILDSLRDAPYSTLIYLLYWAGTVNPANPYAS